MRIRRAILLLKISDVTNAAMEAIESALLIRLLVLEVLV